MAASRPARVRKNKNTQSMFNTFNAVTLLILTKSCKLNTTKVANNKR